VGGDALSYGPDSTHTEKAKTQTNVEMREKDGDCRSKLVSVERGEQSGKTIVRAVRPQFPSPQKSGMFEGIESSAELVSHT
jgi:hypothetical protein